MTVLVIGSSLVSTFSSAQLSPASPPLANPNDRRFEKVREDWTSPSLIGSDLQPVSPLIGFVDEKPTFTVSLIRLQWRWGDPVDVYIMKPKGVKKPPVILYLYGYPTTTEIFMDDDYENLVTKDGVAAVGFVSALTGYRYHDRPMKDWFVSELQESLATSAHDVQMVLNYLTAREDLDTDRVGMFSQGSGASIAILASAVDPRIKVLEALDPWGAWPLWLAGSPFVPDEERSTYLKPEFLSKVSSLDPVNWLPKVQAKHFKLEYELFDPITPKPVKERMQLSVPPGTKVHLFNTMDEMKAALEDGRNLSWIRHELRSLP